jgi:hypothetical protein
MHVKRLLIIFLGAIACSFSFTPASVFKISFEPYFGSEPLVLGKQIYRNNSGDSLSIDLFKFYVSNVSVKIKGKWYPLKKIHHLVNMEEAGSKQLTISAPVNGPVDSLKFLVGIDSVTCVSGNLEGDLDPLKAMYWSWNTGYVNAKIEGRSPSCTTIHQAFEFHVGGYMTPFNTLRMISLNAQNKNELRLKVNAGQWFNGPYQVSLKTSNSIVDVGKQAVKMADNYKDMFEILP